LKSGTELCKDSLQENQVGIIVNPNYRENSLKKLTELSKIDSPQVAGVKENLLLPKVKRREGLKATNVLVP
jgi:hypothetical protein